MQAAESVHPALFSRLVDGLYVEAMVMADEARSYFDIHCAEERDRMDMMARLSFTCESLKVTTRLMHIIAWLLTQRAWQRGEIGWQDLSDPKYLLGEAAPTDKAVIAALPKQAGELVLGSEDLYERVRRLQDKVREADAIASDPERAAAVGSPARSLQSRLERLL